jgi:uncharacterized small protein (TIGR04563 family)
MSCSRRAPSGCKQSVYFQEDLIQELESEAKRLERSMSWVVQRCIKAGGLAAIQNLRTDSAEAAE